MYNIIESQIHFDSRPLYNSININHVQNNSLIIQYQIFYQIYTISVRKSFINAFNCYKTSDHILFSIYDECLTFYECSPCNVDAVKQCRNTYKDELCFAFIIKRIIRESMEDKLVEIFVALMLSANQMSFCLTDSFLCQLCWRFQRLG